MRRTIVVNLFAPPNSQKREVGDALCEQLLSEGITCSMVVQTGKGGETARYSSVKDEIYLFSKQFHKMFRLHGGVEVIVTDRPLMLSLYYNVKYGQGYYTALNNLILEQHSNFYNLNFYLDGKFPGDMFDIPMRELEEMGRELKDTLSQYEVPYTKVTYHNAMVKDMSDIIKAEVMAYRKTDEYKANMEKIDIEEENMQWRR